MPLLADLSQRRRCDEWMDDPDLSEAEHRAALRGLERINRWSGAASSFWSALRRLPRSGQALSILDVGCGGGDVLVQLARCAQRDGVPVVLHGADRSQQALEIARERGERAGRELELHRVDVLTEQLPAGFDVVLSSLFLHHLDEDDACELLANMSKATRSTVLVQDLDRSLSGFSLAHVATRVLTRSTIVHHDGPRSVEQAFTKAEVLALAQRAGLRGASIRSLFPCRWMLSWERVS